ncbi:MAG: hypothetical protein ACRC80_14380, partial [Waterburya sp.]
MIIEKIAEIKDKNLYDRDLIVDSLSDLVATQSLSKKEKIFIVKELAKVLETEKESSVIESIFNLFASAFYNKICKKLIAHRCAKFMMNLDTSSLCHVLPIIGESNLSNKKRLISLYVQSENPEIKKIAEEILL